MQPFDKQASKRAAVNSWAASPALRREFGDDMAAFVAYREAVDRGAVGLRGAPSWATLPPIASVDRAHAQAEREWDQLPAVRSEFVSKESYAAFRVAEAKGRVRLRAPGATRQAAEHAAPAAQATVAPSPAAAGVVVAPLESIAAETAARQPAAPVAPASSGSPAQARAAEAVTALPSGGAVQSGRWRRVLQSDCAALDLAGLLDASVRHPKPPTGPMPNSSNQSPPWWFAGLYRAEFYEHSEEGRRCLGNCREELRKVFGRAPKA